MWRAGRASVSLTRKLLVIIEGFANRMLETSDVFYT